ncbi:hypothetical protein REPUB_Repub13aG0099500 [Reevesia pubescens]
MSFLRPDTPWRVCAANFQQPINQNDEREAQRLMDNVRRYNGNVVYRNSTDEQDLTHRVVRWVPIQNDNDYDEVFYNGLRASPQEGTSDQNYYNLEFYINHAGPPGEPRNTRHAYVSASVSLSFCPRPRGLGPGEERRYYRYEIFAPGGIDAALTLGQLYGHGSQREITFVGGIAPQYIRGVEELRVWIDGATGRPRSRRVNNVMIINALTFNPRPDPNLPLLHLYMPIVESCENRERHLLTLRLYRRRREKRQVSGHVDVSDWYASEVANIPSYITSAFRASATNEAYLFMNNEYVLVNYAPGTTSDWVINGPLFICEGFPSLIGTEFGEYGIECAFDTHYGTEAFIFNGNLVALIDYAPGTTDDKILKGPMTITSMFPFFEGTVFESGVDAAFKATATGEAYLFKGNRYALINYGHSNNRGSLIAIRKITEGFYSLRGTIFETGIEAAFASHVKNEAYLFKGDQYARINFAPGTTNDFIIDNTVKPIRPNWHSLSDKLPRLNHGVDLQIDYASDGHVHYHDEL